MKRSFDIKSFVCIAIVVVGAYLLTHSWAIALGVAILLYVLDSCLYVWAEKKNRQYSGNDTNDGEADTNGNETTENDGETH